MKTKYDYYQTLHHRVQYIYVSTFLKTSKHKYVTVNYLHLLSAHERCDKDLFLQPSISKVIQDHVIVKMKKENIRRWSYQVGFKKFTGNDKFKEIFNYFKQNIADVLAFQGLKIKQV